MRCSRSRPTPSADMKVYVCDLGQFSAEMLTRMQKKLPPKRLAQLEQAHESRRAAGTVGFYLVHYAASREVPIPFADWEYGQGGKPHLRDCTVEFSLSHTAHAVAVAVSPTHPVGVDIEVIRPHANGFATRWFSPEECARLDSADDRDTALIALWCAKEAVAKCSGTGLCGHVAAIDATDAVTARLSLGDVPHVLALSPAGAYDLISVDATALN